MRALRRVAVCIVGGAVAGCIAPPAFELPGAGNPFDTDDGGYDPFASSAAGDGSDADGSGSTGGAAGGDSGGPPGGSDPSSDGETWTSGRATDGGDAGGDGDAEEGTSGEPQGESSTGADAAGFPPAPAFGDDPEEAALVGTWGVSWAPAGRPDLNLFVEDDGAFRWVETSADCGQTVVATGVLWTEDGALVMHVDTWAKRDPWPVQAMTGQPLERPFRMRLPFATEADALDISGPQALTDLLPWQSRAYRRHEAGVGPLGEWTAMAELWVIRDGEEAPAKIVSEAYELSASVGAQATIRTTTSWWHDDAPIHEDPVVETGGWYNQTPGQTQGMGWIAGATYLYDEVRLAVYDEHRTLRKGVTTDCG